MTADQIEDPRQAVFLRRLGLDIRKLREDARLSQGQVADVFHWKRAAISKIENGQRNVSVYAYLCLIDFLKAVEPAHPAVQLAQRLLPPASQHPGNPRP